MSRTAHEKREINDYLGSRGLATLDDPQGMYLQLAFWVRDHAHFRSLLIRCVPEERRSMYDALAPNLRFKAKLLDEYIIEAQQDAEARQLPTVDEAGNFHPYNPPQVGLASAELTAAVQGAAEAAVAKHRLELTCSKCTKSEAFIGVRKADAVQAARDAGWLYFEVDGKAREICPDCPCSRN